MPDHDLEISLAALRPRPPGPQVLAGIARELDAATERRGHVIAWTAGLSAVAASAAVAFLVFAAPAETEVRAYRLVRAEQSPARVEMFAPVRLEDGSYARPVRVRWDHTTHWEDARARAQFIDYRPNEQLALLPLETY